MVRSSKSDRLFIRTLEGDLAYAAQRINDVAPSLVDSIVTLQQFGTGRSAQSTVVFAIAPDGACTSTRCGKRPTHGPPNSSIVCNSINTI